MNSIPADDPERRLTHARAESSEVPHVGVAGGIYTILVTGKDTAGRYCLIDMLVPPGGGPPAHRHDFEESFTVLEGEIETTFRGHKSTVRAGEVINIPANAPHRFENKSQNPARLLCLCVPAAQEEFFLEIGTPVTTRTATPPKPTEEEANSTRDKVAALAPKYKTEFVKEA
jgi:quercetin dioxygenase-like cupin family protein